jgi:hypothetical protein
MDYLMRQIGKETGPGSLCEWCLKRETAYRETFGWPDQDCVFGAGRDVVCWQLNREEAGVCELLKAFGEATTGARLWSSGSSIT